MTTPNLDRMRRHSYLEWTLWNQLDQERPRLPMPKWQYQIGGSGHKWDFGWESRRVLVEVQGGTYARGAHTRGAGYAADRIRSNLAQLDGWLVLEFTGGQVQDGTALDTIKVAMEGRR